MAKNSIYAKVEKQYKSFLDAWHAIEDARIKCDTTDEQAVADWEKFWGEWLVCRAADLPQFVSFCLHLNERGIPVAYVSFDDPVADDIFPEIKLEDLVASCWSGWASKDADSDDAIEAKLRAAFEKGLKRAKKAKFE